MKGRKPPLKQDQTRPTLTAPRGTQGHNAPE